MTDPTRIVTTTVRVEGGLSRTLPVKTKRDIPKDKVLEVVEFLK